MQCACMKWNVVAKPMRVSYLSHGELHSNYFWNAAFDGLFEELGSFSKGLKMLNVSAKVKAIWNSLRFNPLSSF